MWKKDLLNSTHCDKFQQCEIEGNLFVQMEYIYQNLLQIYVSEIVESFLFNSLAQVNIALVIPESIVIYIERKYIKIQRLERIKYVLI